MERKGVEPSTSALRTQERCAANDDSSAFETSPPPVCTSVCTSEPENVNGAAPSPAADDGTVKALAAMLAALDPMTRKAIARLLENDGK